MPRCAICQHRFSPGERRSAICPRCGARLADGPREDDSLGDSARAHQLLAYRACQDDWLTSGQPSEPADDPDAWVSIARLANLAEVGYFADILEGDGIATRVTQHQEFNALDGSWQMLFVLQVPGPQSAEAVGRLRQALDRSADDSPDGAGSGGVLGSIARLHRWLTTSFLWKPVVFVLIVGGVFYTTRQVPRVGADAPRPRPSLWDALIETDQTFRGEAGPGLQARRLVPDPGSRSLWLYEDTNGDGVADRARCFREGRLVGEMNR